MERESFVSPFLLLFSLKKIALYHIIWYNESILRTKAGECIHAGND